MVSMPLKFQLTTNEELNLLHDFYFESSEPDAPKDKLENLSEGERQTVLSAYHLDSYRSVFDETILVGFVGFFPDDDCNVNLFYVVSPSERGKGFFSKFLDLSIDHCRKEFSEFRNLRVLTRKKNIASIKGLERASFIRRGVIIEAIQPDVIYEEYLFQL